MQIRLSVKNMSNLKIKEIKGKFDNRNPTKEQIRKCKRYEKNLSTI